MTVPDQGSVLPKTSVPTQVPSQPLRYGPGNASLVSFASRNIAFRNFRERGLFKKRLFNKNAETFRTVGHVELLQNVSFMN
jgi:hypothetical protein